MKIKHTINVIIHLIDSVMSSGQLTIDKDKQ